ncbi:hypothetical protein C1N74_16305 (plasmid) [Microbacterium sp. SGAir0570]|nr:hypothetical protein C1N74_16305 [Microbacterium sp. SGAir0570]
MRGLLASSFATFIALMSHVAAGGTVPGVLGVVVPWVLSLFVCVLLAGRALSLARLTLAVMLSQSLFHVLFVLGSFSPSGSSSVGGHHSHAHSMVMTGGGAMTSALHGDVSMWLAHGVAAAVTVAALYRGERAARSMLELFAKLRSWVRLVFARLVGLVLAPSRRRIAPVFSLTLVLTSVLPFASVSRRGPPSLSAL